MQLAAIGNCSIASLITPEGRHTWFCLPRLDGDPVFCALVDGEEPSAGFHDVLLTSASSWSQRYVRNTAILETYGTDAQGAVFKIVDFAPRHERFGRSFHPQTIVRILSPVSGRPRIRVRVRPRFNYGRERAEIHVGSNHIRFVGEALSMRVTTDMPLSYVVDETEFVLDRPVHIFIGSDETIPERLDALAANFLTETQAYWEKWVRGLSIPFEWQDCTIRSAITLKLCSFEDTGAIVAALTTSIPEAPNTNRTWDYRYCWIRDAYFTVGALNRLGATRTMEGFIRFILDSVLCGHSSRTIAPLFRISGHQDLAEHIAPDLSGYRSMGPVRFGNAAVRQTQNDVFGSIVLTATQMFWDQRLNTNGDRDLYAQLTSAGQMAMQCAFAPDSGPWEYRGKEAVHTYSVAMCWAACHRLAMIAMHLGLKSDADMWMTAAAGIRSKLLSLATTKDGWISGRLDAEMVDASTLLLPEIGLIQATDPRMLRTLSVISDRLLKDGFLYRYREADDFGEPQTAFLVCTFWYIDALALAGRKDEARTLFENTIRCRNHVGLLSEDIDTSSRELWGNFPQAYSHVGLIHSASRISRGWEETLWRAG